MKTVFQHRDRAQAAFIEPTVAVSRLEGFPERVIATFSKDIIDRYAEMEGTEKIGMFISVNGKTPVFKRKFAGTEMAFYKAMVGAPTSAAQLEEVIAMGGKKFVFFGCCGVLDERADGKILIPEAAIREEGTSYHYIEPAVEIAMARGSVENIAACAEELNYPYIKGKVWTTDAIYRETNAQIAGWRQEGCLGVEMECAALLAVAQFRGVSLAQFLFGADSLTGDQWDQRDLLDNGRTQADLYMELAAMVASRL